MTHGPVRYLPESCYPFRLEAFHPDTRVVVWSTVVEKPMNGELGSVFIPPIAKQFGHPVGIRTIWPDGTKTEVMP